MAATRSLEAYRGWSTSSSRLEPEGESCLFSSVGHGLTAFVVVPTRPQPPHAYHYPCLSIHVRHSQRHGFHAAYHDRRVQARFASLNLPLLQVCSYRSGSEIVDKVIAGEAEWFSLFAKHDFFFRYKFYLQVVASSPDLDIQNKWYVCWNSGVKL